VAWTESRQGQACAGEAPAERKRESSGVQSLSKNFEALPTFPTTYIITYLLQSTLYTSILLQTLYI